MTRSSPMPSQRELLALLDSIPLFAGFLNRDGRITLANEAAVKVIERSKGEVIGQFFWETEWWCDLPESVILIKNAHREALLGKPQRFDISYNSVVEGKRVLRWVDFSMQPLSDDSGQVSLVTTTGFDITDRTRSAEELRLSEERLTLAIEASDLGVWDWDCVRDEAILSPRYWQMIGYGINEVRADFAFFQNIIHPDDVPIITKVMQAHLEGATHHSEIVYRVQRKSGNYFWMRGMGRVVNRDPSGVPLRMIGIVMDVSEQKRVEAELKFSKTQAERANRAKDMFLTTLSHELRTPLSAILSWAQLLRKIGVESDKVKTGLQVIEASAFSQNQLIEDMLDLSRIISGKMQVVCRPTDILADLSATVDAFRPEAEKKSIAINQYIEVDPLIVSADSKRMRQVFRNLLSNAVKFTPQGGSIDVRVTALDDLHDPRAVIKIHDTGKGISPEFLPYLFDRFSQADVSSVQIHGGLGIGLALSKNLLLLQGAEIHAESPGVGKGATFTILLPLGIPQAERSRLGESDSKTGCVVDLSGIKVLLVDDQKNSLIAVSEALSFYGAVVRAASSVSEALSIYQDFCPELILTDIAMPNEDGYSLIQKIRAMGPEHHDIPMIALTAYVGSSFRDRVLSSGFKEYLTKPVEVGHLAKVIKKCVEP